MLAAHRAQLFYDARHRFGTVSDSPGNASVLAEMGPFAGHFPTLRPANLQRHSQCTQAIITSTNFLSALERCVSCSCSVGSRVGLLVPTPFVTSNRSAGHAGHASGFFCTGIVVNSVLLRSPTWLPTLGNKKVKVQRIPKKTQSRKTHTQYCPGQDALTRSFLHTSGVLSRHC